jgi:Putative lumazine-binding
MRRLLAVLFTLAGLAARAADDQTPIAVVQRLFAAMTTHDAAAARALFLPEAMLFSVRADGTANAMPHDRWVERMGASKDAWLERIWEPKQLEHGSVAIVWAEFDFHLNGKFSHCGIDSFSLLKTASGWKIASISDTHETTGCTPSPLGPPPGSAK